MKSHLHVWVWRGMGVLSWHASSLLSLRLLARDASDHLLQQMHTLEGQYGFPGSCNSLVKNQDRPSTLLPCVLQHATCAAEGSHAIRDNASLQ